MIEVLSGHFVPNATADGTCYLPVFHRNINAVVRDYRQDNHVGAVAVAGVAGLKGVSQSQFRFVSI